MIGFHCSSRKWESCRFLIWHLVQLVNLEPLAGEAVELEESSRVQLLPCEWNDLVSGSPYMIREPSIGYYPRDFVISFQRKKERPLRTHLEPESLIWKAEKCNIKYSSNTACLKSCHLHDENLLFWCYWFLCVFFKENIFYWCKAKKKKKKKCSKRQFNGARNFIERCRSPGLVWKIRNMFRDDASCRPLRFTREGLPGGLSRLRVNLLVRNEENSTSILLMNA